MHSADLETAHLVEDAAAALFSRIGVLSRAEQETTGASEERDWAEVESAGFTTALCTPENGGVAPAHAILIAIRAGKHAVDAPVAETMAVNWLLQRTGLPSLQGRATFSDQLVVAERTEQGDLRIKARLNSVPYARQCDHLCFLATSGGEPALVLLRRSEFEVAPRTNMAGEARDACAIDVVIPDHRAVRPAKMFAENELHALGALLRAAQMAGAMAAAQELTVRYATERQQFGRKLTAFQAVQQHLAVMATQVAAARSATLLGASALGDTIDDRLVACAKVRVGEAAGAVAAIAHQVHGAIGFTAEYSLNHLTRRLWAWRDEFGGEAEWAARLGETLLGSPDPLWPQVTALAPP